MDEFEAIDAMVGMLGSATTSPGVAIGPGDDAAVLELPAGHQLVVSTDTLVAGRHFPSDAMPDVVAYRSMAVAASDLAAMGATPAYATVSLTLERLSESWAMQFASGIATAARRFRLAVVGGNVARGPFNVTVTVHGHVPRGAAITRSGARVGDHVYVTGLLGGASLALKDPKLADCLLTDLGKDTPRRRFWKPEPRLAFAETLRGIAGAAIDISDGLSSDLRHLCSASGVAGRVALERLPVYRRCSPRRAATAGDDYELVFTSAPGHDSEIASLAQHAGVPVQVIGAVQDGKPGDVEWRHNGRRVKLPKGYRHF